MMGSIRHWQMDPPVDLTPVSK